MLRQLWQTRVHVICDLLLYGTFIPFVLYEIFILVSDVKQWLHRRRQHKAED